jgi:glycosyltransferase involved in cell wall biosynthesis
MISVAIPTYNRVELLFESFAKVLDDPRVSEIVIVDDASDAHIWQEINELWMFAHPKIKLFRNEKNLDCYRNKREAVSKATNEWVILLDSDNVIGVDYLDAVMRYVDDSNKDTIMQPSFAMPHFDFRSFSRQSFDHYNVAGNMVFTNFETMLNACNFVVNRDEYLRVWDGSVDPVTSDSIYFNYKWLEAGNSIYVVPGMHYEHRVNNHGKEAKSHYMENHRRTKRGFHEDIVQRLKSMR